VATRSGIGVRAYASEVRAFAANAFEARAFGAYAFAAYASVTPFLHVSLGAPDFVAVIKTVLHHRGVIASPEVRTPLLAPSARRHAEILAAL